MIKNLLKNELVRYGLVLFIGVTIGVLFYPSKRIEEKLTYKFQEQITELKETHSKELSKVQEQYNEQVKENKTLIVEHSKEVNKLSVEIKDLKMKQKTAKYKIVRPDGTIEEKEFTETETSESSKVITQIQEEFKTKITSIEQKWTDIHKQRVTEIQKDFSQKEASYKQTIEELQKSKTVSINEKKFGVEVGVLTNKDYYGHATMDIWGPVFLGVHGQTSQSFNNNEVGAGIGFRF